jgi:hypothetical protein
LRPFKQKDTIFSYMATPAADKTDKSPATSAPTAKGETRLFQTAPGEKKQLTKAEAQKAGFFWKDDEPKKK